MITTYYYTQRNGVEIKQIMLAYIWPASAAFSAKKFKTIE